MNKNVFKAMWLSVMAVAVVTVSSCSSDSDFFGLDGLEDIYNQRNGMIESNEYIDYLESMIEFNEFFMNPIISQEDSIGRIGDKTIYSISYKNILQQERNAYNKLIKRYPYYAHMSKEEKIAITLSVILHDERFKTSRITTSLTSSTLTRAKNSNPEAIAFTIIPYKCTEGSYTMEPYFLYTDAHNACKNYSKKYNKESGGFTFQDYSSIFIIDANASSSSCNLPILNWGSNIPVFAYHYHPTNGNYSSADSASMQSLPCPLYIIHESTFSLIK